MWGALQTRAVDGALLRLEVSSNGVADPARRRPGPIRAKCNTVCYANTLRIFFTLGPALRARQSGQLACQGELGYRIVWMHQGDKR
jgi:hypothetical protein